MNHFDSIFIEHNKENKLWQKVEKGYEDKNRISFQAYALKSSKASVTEKILDLRFFYIQESYLCYKKTEKSRKTKGKIDLRYTRVTFQREEQVEENNKKCKYSMSFCRGRNYTVLFLQEEEEIQQWRNALKQFVIFSDVHEMFIPFVDEITSLKRFFKKETQNVKN